MPGNVNSSVVKLSKYDSLDKLPIHQQAIQVISMFGNAKDLQEYTEISARWLKVRKGLVEYEKSQSCKDSGSASDWDIALGVIDDLYKAPLGVIKSVTELAISIMDGEKDSAAANLEKAWDDIKKEGWDQLKEKVGEKIDQKTKRIRELAYEKLREALLKYLQSVSKRSRSHFLKLIGNAVGIIKVGAKVATTALGLMLTPSKITPEWCGLLKDGDEAQNAASSRLLPRTTERVLSFNSKTKQPMKASQN